jgi:hypothetical protein
LTKTTRLTRNPDGSYSGTYRGQAFTVRREAVRFEEKLAELRARSANGRTVAQITP